MDVTQALRDTENTLRDFIAASLERSLGQDWLDRCGVTPERIAEWRDRKSVEQRRQEAGVVEERLLYYADLYDLKTILKKHWQGDFSEALGEWKRFEVLFDELARYRDPDAHRRDCGQVSGLNESLYSTYQRIVCLSFDVVRRWKHHRKFLQQCRPRSPSKSPTFSGII